MMNNFKFNIMNIDEENNSFIIQINDFFQIAITRRNKNSFFDLLDNIFIVGINFLENKSSFLFEITNKDYFNNIDINDISSFYQKDFTIEYNIDSQNQTTNNYEVIIK